MANESIRGITVRYLLVLAMLGVLAVVSYSILLQITNAQDADAAVINMSGRQRMLSQQIALLSTQLTNTRDTAGYEAVREELLDAIDLMVRSHEKLIGAELSTEVEALYFGVPVQLDRQVRDYLSAAAAFARAPDAVGLGVRPSTRLVDSLNAVVLQYQKEANAAVARLKIVEATILGTTLLVLLATGVLVFRPMVRRIEGQTEELKESEGRLRAVIDNAADGIITIDDRSAIQSFNAAAENIFGYRAEEVTGKNVNLLMPEPHRSEHDGYIANYLRTGEAHVIGFGREAQGVRKDGTTFLLDLAVSEVRHGQERRFIGLLRDITERKEAEDALKRTARELARSNAELEQFAYVASHDLQEPLRMVASYTQLLARRYQGKLDAEADEFIAFAVDGANRMQGLINDLLAYSRVETRGRPPQPCDANAAVQRALTHLHMAVQETGAVVTVQPLPTVAADETQLLQLFQNLIGNAIKFRGDQTPHIQVSAQPAEGPAAEDKPDGGWVFSVQDNGIGIDPAYLGRIFGIFQRLHTRAKYPGSGIGLAICKRIVERHGGRIWIESQPGAGSTFHFTLPAAPPTSPVAVEQS